MKVKFKCFALFAMLSVLAVSCHHNARDDTWRAELARLC